MGRYTSAKSFDDRSTEITAAPTEAEKAAASEDKKDVLQVSNTMGSTAGAGSGDFHQYRNSRRRELFRLEKIDLDAKKADDIAEFEQRKRERADDEEEKRLKRAAKRQKKKGKKKGGKGGGGVADAGGEGAAGGDDDDEEDGEGERIVGPLMPRGADSGVYVNGVTETENIKVKEVANVRIIDDDDD